MKRRACVPLSVPRTAAHDDHGVPSFRLYRIEFGESVLMTKSQVEDPSFAPNRPARALNAWPGPNGGGAGALDQVLAAALYAAASIPVPAEDEQQSEVFANHKVQRRQEGCHEGRESRSAAVSMR